MLFQSVVILISLTVCDAAGPLCFSCSGIQQARYCDYTERCADHQVCHVKKILTNSGHHVYASGCVNNATCGIKRSAALSAAHGDITCIECCHGDMCNNKGCGDSGPPKRQYRGPYCFQCDHMSRPSECEQLTVCELDEECAIEEYATGFFGEHTFSSGCKRKEQCASYQPFGRRATHQKRLQLCDKCCSGDFCNKNCDGAAVAPVAVTHLEHWLSWGAWSECPKGTCSSSHYQIRQRVCFDNATHQEVHTCPGASRENRTCGGECKDCKALYDAGVRTNGVYKITPYTGDSFDVFCDMDDGGWIDIQNRFNGSVNFTRGWANYTNGFGSLNGEFWLGLDKIYDLTNPRDRMIKLDMKTDNNKTLTVMYRHFLVGDALSNYTLHLDSFINGTISSSSFSYNNNQKFTTFDHSNGNTCAKRHHGGWWYGGCTYLNLNGQYGVKFSESGMIEHYHSYNNFISARMKVQ